MAGLSKGSAPEDMQYIMSSEVKHEFISRDPRQRAGHEKDGASISHHENRFSDTHRKLLRRTLTIS
ncbi:MAG: hypothetical protein LBU32_24585 [Clostridiales bacterium]|nr:hypothetical protein [Clostridiales bacterium]